MKKTLIILSVLFVCVYALDLHASNRLAFRPAVNKIVAPIAEAIGLEQSALKVTFEESMGKIAGASGSAGLIGRLTGSKYSGEFSLSDIALNTAETNGDLSSLIEAANYGVDLSIFFSGAESVSLKDLSEIVMEEIQRLYLKYETTEDSLIGDNARVYSYVMLIHNLLSNTCFTDKSGLPGDTSSAILYELLVARYVLKGSNYTINSQMRSRVEKLNFDLRQLIVEEQIFGTEGISIERIMNNISESTWMTVLSRYKNAKETEIETLMQAANVLAEICKILGIISDDTFKKITENTGRFLDKYCDNAALAILQNRTPLRNGRVLIF